MWLSSKVTVLAVAPLFSVLLTPSCSKAFFLEALGIAAIGKLVGKGLINDAKEAVNEVTRDVDARLEQRIKQAGGEARETVRVAGEEARRTVAELNKALQERIDQAGKLAAHEREAFFRQFAEERRELFREVDIRIARLDASLDGKLDRVEQVLRNSISDLKSILDPPVITGLGKLAGLSPGLYREVGLIQGYRVTGMHSVWLIGRGLGGEEKNQLEDVKVTVNKKAIETRFGGEPYTRVAEIPADLLAGSFKDTEPGSAELLVKGKGFENRRTVRLLPRFPIEYYEAYAEVPGERELQRVYLDTPGKDLIEATKAAARPAGEDAVALALGKLFATARQRLPFGSHLIALPPGGKWRELKVRWHEGSTATLYPGAASKLGVSVAEESGSIRVTIDDPTARGLAGLIK